MKNERQVHRRRFRVSQGVRKHLQNARAERARIANTRRAHIHTVSRTMRPISIGIINESKYNDQTRHRCKPYDSGKFVSILMPRGLHNDTKKQLRSCLDRQRLITEGIEIIPVLSDGSYIFIISADDPEHVRLFIMPVLSTMEIRSVHAILALRAGVTHVIGAGEIRKTGKRVEYNNMSGTYMVGYKNEGKAIELIKIMFESLHEYGMEPVYNTTDETLITGDVHESEVRHAVDCGYTAEIYNDGSTCMLDQRYITAKAKGQAKDFLRARRNINVSLKNRLLNTNNSMLPERLFEPVRTLVRREGMEMSL